MTGSTQLVASGQDDGVSVVTNIGFTFTYAGTAYTQFSVNANGLMRLGATAVTLNILIVQQMQMQLHLVSCLIGTIYTQVSEVRFIIF